MTPLETLPTAILAGLGLAPDRVSRLGSGLASQAWKVDAAGASSVLRISSWDPGEPTTYRSEHAVMARLVEVGAPVPDPITGDWRHPDLPGPSFSLTSFLDGLPWRPNPEDAVAVRLVADFIGQLQSIEVRGFGPLIQDDAVEGLRDDPVDGLRERWSGLHAWLVDDVELSRHPAWADHRDLLERAGAHASAALDDALAGPMVLVHSDLHEENILDAEGRLGFIDFGETFRGAAAWEYASMAYFLGWSVADAVLSAAVEPGVVAGFRRPSVTRLALSFGLSRWEQDRESRVDEEAHDEAFLRASLARL